MSHSPVGPDAHSARVSCGLRRISAGNRCGISLSVPDRKGERERWGGCYHWAVPGNSGERLALCSAASGPRHNLGRQPRSAISGSDTVGEKRVPPWSCELCLEGAAFYVCQECGRSVCQGCWRGLCCKACTEDKASIGKSENRVPRLLGSAAILAVIFGSVLVIIGSLLGGGTSGACFVWPVPLIVSCGLGEGPVGADFVIILLGFLALSLLAVWSFRRLLRGRMPQ